jgi:NAD(P)-dependent dehydrogenase (short-subunit alcohol dehydrogenase family)
MGTERKVAVITGASQGIGAALVQAYRDRNFRVVVTARSVKPSSDADVLVVSGDIADRKTAERAISGGVARFGRIDTKPTTPPSWASTSLGSSTSPNSPSPEKQGSGHVVQITTSLVDHANSRVPAVLASLTKGDLNAATKSLAIEYAKHGIRVNAVAPGIIKSPMHPVETHEALGALHPVGHMGEISDIVEAILYLESPSFVTGEILHVDGGQSAGR